VVCAPPLAFRSPLLNRPPALGLSVPEGSVER